MARWCVSLVTSALLVVGCSTGSARTSTSVAPESEEAFAASVSVGGSACEWLTSMTVAAAVSGPPEVVGPAADDPDVWGCSLRSKAAELTVRFVRFASTGRSVEAELLRIRGEVGDALMMIANLRGAVVRPGVWFGETPLQQYGMAQVRLSLLDGTPLDESRFLQVVERVLTDVTAAALQCSGGAALGAAKPCS